MKVAHFYWGNESIEIKRKGFYECVNEQRTYDISSIEKGECLEN